MMTLKLRIVILVLLISALVYIIYMVKQRTMELKYVLVWLACDIIIVILTLFPGLINAMASMLGIHSPMNMLFFLGLVFSLFIIFSLTKAISKVTDRVRRLAQIVALLPDDILEEVETRLKESDSSMTCDFSMKDGKTGCPAGAEEKPANK